MPELIHSQLSEAAQHRLIRIMIDVRALGQQLTLAQVRSVHGDIEEVRDLLSRILDQADGKC